MVYASNVNVSLQYNLNDYDDGDDDLYHVVVQKGNVGSSYVYALQLLHSQHNIYVFRGSRQKVVTIPLAMLSQLLQQSQLPRL